MRRETAPATSTGKTAQPGGSDPELAASKARYGIGHTRWATHGRPTEENAHPHRDCTGQYVVVHNGIIENYLELKEKLQKEGHKFVTETDTEIVAHLVEKYAKDLPFEEAVRKTLKDLRGIYSLVFFQPRIRRS